MLILGCDGGVFNKREKSFLEAIVPTLNAYGTVQLKCSVDDVQTVKSYLKGKHYSYELLRDEGNGMYLFNVYVVVKFNNESVKPA